MAASRLYTLGSQRISARSAWIAGAVMLLVVAGLFFWIHPMIDQQGFSVFGRAIGAADADDAMDIGVRRLLGGLYPYSETTFLGLPISPLPGALFLAAPFYVLGQTAVQNLFWLAAGWFLLSRSSGGVKGASFWLGLMLVVSPVVLYSLLQGGDSLSNGIYVLCILVAFVSRCKIQSLGFMDLLVAIGLGVALSSRLNFLALAPFIAGITLRIHPRKALLIGGLAALVFLLITVPFYLVAPAEFSPLHTMGRLRASTFPMLGKIWPLLILLFSAASAWMGRIGSLSQIWKRCFHIELAVVVGGFVIGSMALGRPDWSLLGYGLLAMPFAIAGYGPEFLHREKTV